MQVRKYAIHGWYGWIIFNISFRYEYKWDFFSGTRTPVIEVSFCWGDGGTPRIRLYVLRIRDYPYIWGRSEDFQFDYNNIFQVGWFNHLDLL